MPQLVGVAFACVVSGLLLQACQMVANITDRTLASESSGGTWEGTGGTDTAVGGANVATSGAGAGGTGGTGGSITQTASSQSTAVNSEGGGGLSISGGTGANVSAGGALSIGGAAINGGTTGNGSSATTGGTLATGGSTNTSACVMGSTENCTDGIDNNCDGLIDCADSTCRNVGYECIAVPPGWVGPVAIWQGSPSSAPQNCAAGLQVAVQSVYRDMSVPSSACGCDCGSATSQNCGSAAMTLYSNDVCGDECGNAEVSSSQCGTVVNSGTCGAAFTASAISPIATGGSCTPQVVSSIPKATWNTELFACAAENSAGAGGCDESNSHCLIAPNPGAPYQTARCVYKVADPPVASCPAGYTKGPSVFYSGISDTRVCSGCTCGAPTSGTCSGTITIYYRPRCEGTPTPFTIGQGCQQFNLGNGTATTVVGEFSVNKAGTCAKASDAVLSGTVQGTGAVTVCCSP